MSMPCLKPSQPRTYRVEGSTNQRVRMLLDRNRQILASPYVVTVLLCSHCKLSCITKLATVLSGLDEVK